MQFLFVTKIHEYSGSHITGQVAFSEREPWRFQTGDQKEFVSVSVVSEAIGQLVSWLSLNNTSFYGRPVFLFASKIDLSAGVPVGAVVQLSARLTNETPDAFMFSGEATYEGKTIVRIEDCGGYLMPLAELEDPEVTRTRFEGLTATAGVDRNPALPAFNFSTLIDNVESLISTNDLKEIRCSKTFSSDEPFYADHFPRFPVTPIVVINEVIGRATTLLVENGRPRSTSIEPSFVQDLKIRSFIKPNDRAEVRVQIIESTESFIETIAEISINGRRILRGRYGYTLRQNTRSL